MAGHIGQTVKRFVPFQATMGPPGGPYPVGPAYFPPVVVVQRAPAPPQPRGVPSRGLFQIGAGGQFFLAATAIVLGILFLADFQRGLGTSAFQLVAGALLFAGLTLQLAGFYGLWRNYGSAMGAVTAGFGLASGILFLLGVVFAFFLREERCYGYYGGPTCYYSVPFWVSILFFLGLIFLGVTFILEGVSYLVSRHHLGTAGGAVGAGVVSIIGGAFLCSVFLAVYGGMFVIAAAAIVGGIVFSMARLPSFVRPPGL